MTDRSLHPWDERGESPPPPNSEGGPAWEPAARRDWPTYFARIEGKPPRKTLLDALHRFDAEETMRGPTPPLCIDLGCGSGIDAAELRRRGWAVFGIDGHREGLQRLLARPEFEPSPLLTLRLALFEDLGPLPPCRLLNASFSLPFCEPAHFERVWSACVEAIEPGGRFAGQFFGDRDTWASIPDRTHRSRDAARACFDWAEIEMFDEEERDGEDAKGNVKHWHVFHIVARKRT